MTPEKQIAALRCATCERAPTPDEQAEMLKNFGHKIRGIARPERLVWYCAGCGTPKALQKMRPS